MKITLYALIALILGPLLWNCSTVPKAPEPIPSPTPSLSTSPTPVPSGSPGLAFTDPVPLGQKLKIYYDQDPTTLKYGWGDVNVFDQDSGAFPQFRVKVAQAVNDAIHERPNAINCGYIALGYSRGGSIRVNPGSYTHILSIAQIQEHTERWLSIHPKLNCIFLDMAGKDYAYIVGKGKIEKESGGYESWVTDEIRLQAETEFTHRQMVVARYLWSKGVVTIWNSWQPQWIPIKELRSTDAYLFENAQNDKARGYKRQTFWQANRPAGARAYAVTTGSYDRASLEAAAKQYGISAIQYKTNDAFENEE